MQGIKPPNKVCLTNLIWGLIIIPINKPYVYEGDLILDQFYDEDNAAKKSRRQELRERMMKYGLKDMNIEEVVELILYFTVRSKDASAIARELVKRFGTIDRMAKATSVERKKIRGIGNSTDQHFAMIGMFIPYVFRNRFPEFPQLDTMEKIKEFCITLQLKHEYEVMYVLCLDSRNSLIKPETRITMGTPKSANVELKHIMDCVANTSTSKVILTHNHPGGKLEPSINDIKFTKIAQSSLKLITIDLYDHIIVADNSALSMRELGLIR